MNPIAIVTSRLRVEEKLLLQELARRECPVERVDDGALQLGLAIAPDGERAPWSLVWNRSLAFGRTLYASRTLEAKGIRCVNSADVVETCGDKARTSLALEVAGVPTPATTIAFTPESALEAAEAMGYPVVLKPVVGSWGRLVARLDNRAAAEAVLEHRSVLGGWQDNVFYLQEYVDKPGRDARVFVAGDEVLGGIWRHAEHWITNTARGATVSCADVSGELGEIALAAARAVGGGLLAIDVVEHAAGLSILEVNHSGEFRNSIEPTGVDLPGAMVDWVLSQVPRPEVLA